MKYDHDYSWLVRRLSLTKFHIVFRVVAIAKYTSHTTMSIFLKSFAGALTSLYSHKVLGLKALNCEN